MTALPDGAAYFLYHSIGQYPGKTADLARAMAEFAGVWGRADTAQWDWVLERRARFVQRWRAILNAPEASLTTAENVTAALHMLISALPGEVLRGKRLLVAADCFPSVHFLLAGMAERYGFNLDTVALRQGAAWVEPEDFIAQWGPDVGLALVTWISSTSSHRVEMAPLVAHARAMGSLIGVDVTQGAGLLPFDVQQPAVDFAVSTSLKWMCGTPGAGILQVAPGLIARCHPELRGWFSQPDPFNWDITRFSYAEDIRRFDNGTPAVIAALASLPALDWHAAQDHGALAAHNAGLQAQILDGIAGLDLPLLSPADPARRGGSLMLRLPDHLPAPEAVARLSAAGIHCDARGQTLRASPGIMTNAAGVTQLLHGLHGLLRPARASL